MLDLWELENGLNPLIDDSMLDIDGDGISNLQEYLKETDPRQKELEEVPFLFWIIVPIAVIAPIVGFLYLRWNKLDTGS